MNGKVTLERKLDPVDGGPATHEGRDEHGDPLMAVQLREFTPLRLKGAEALSGTAALAIGVLAGFGLHTLGVTGPALLIAWMLILMAGGYLAMHFIYGKLLKNTELVFTPQEFRVRTRKGWDIYDRRLPHRFRMEKHDKARQEREKHELKIRRAQMHGNVIAPTRYYDDSYHIVFEYMGQRFDIATVYHDKRAERIVAHLRYCDEKMNAMSNMSPNEQWDEVSGRVPGA